MTAETELGTIDNPISVMKNVKFERNSQNTALEVMDEEFRKLAAEFGGEAIAHRNPEDQRSTSIWTGKFTFGPPTQGRRR